VDSVPFSTARANLEELMDRVCDNHETLIIIRNGEPYVVMMPLKDFQSLEETAYLLRSPKNASRLLGSISQFQAGRGVERKL
jgi:antitoxin YefM